MIEAKPLTPEEIAYLKGCGGPLTSEEHQRLFATIEQQNEQIECLLEALVEISKGAGPFNRDPMKHAENCIEAIKEAACKALAATEPKP